MGQNGYSPRGCPWRNGTAERAVGLAKTTLQHQLKRDKNLNYAQMDELFLRVANIINSRPTGVRMLTEEVYHPITPNNLLLGRASGPIKEPEDDLEDIQEGGNAEANRLLTAQEELCEKWWTKWSEVAFPLLAPRKKWSQVHRNVQVGDIVLLRYDSKLSRARYRLAKVVLIHPDDCGVVRTVTVNLRPRHKREKALPYKSKVMTEFPVAVQRLVVIVPKEEQSELQPREKGGEDQQIRVEEGPVTQNHEEDVGSVSPDCDRSRLQRRSRRLRGEAPEKFLAAMGHGLVPKPWDVPKCLAASYSLYPGASPLLVPAWLPEIIEAGIEDADDDE